MSMNPDFLSKNTIYKRAESKMCKKKTHPSKLLNNSLCIVLYIHAHKYATVIIPKYLTQEFQTAL